MLAGTGTGGGDSSSSSGSSSDSGDGDLIPELAADAAVMDEVGGVGGGGRCGDCRNPYHCSNIVFLFLLLLLPHLPQDTAMEEDIDAVVAGLRDDGDGGGAQ